MDNSNGNFLKIEKIEEKEETKKIKEIKKIKIINDSLGYLVNGANVGEVHAGLSDYDASRIERGKAELVAAIIENDSCFVLIPEDERDLTGDDRESIDVIERVEDLPTDDKTKDDDSDIETDIPEDEQDLTGDDRESIDYIDRDSDISSDDRKQRGGFGFSRDGGWTKRDSEFNPLPGLDDVIDRVVSEKEEDDDDEKKLTLGIPIPIAIIGGLSAIGLTFCLGQCQGVPTLPEMPQITFENPLVDVHEQHYIELSNVVDVREITDLYFSSEEFLKGSQVRSPGEIIDELKDKAWAEELGRAEGREEYDAEGGEQHAEEEREIQDFNRRFEEQSEKIQEYRKVIENKASSREEVEEALIGMYGAKQMQYELYGSGYGIMDRYYSKAIDAVSKPGFEDDRTEDEIKQIEGVRNQYADGKANLEMDWMKLHQVIDIIQNPEEHEDTFFDKTAEETFEAEDKGDVVNTLEALGPFGHREVVDEKVETNVSINENKAGQVHEGVIDSTQTREVTVKETRLGLTAVFHKIGDFFSDIMHENKHDADEKIDIDSNENEEVR